MKTMNFVKNLSVIALLFVACVTVSARNYSNNLIYNSEEVNGVKVSETVYKMNDNMLTNYMKYSYKYNENNQMTENIAQKWDNNEKCWNNHMCIRYSYDNKSVTTEYYKWNAKKNQFILDPSMTLTMDK